MGLGDWGQSLVNAAQQVSNYAGSKAQQAATSATNAYNGAVEAADSVVASVQQTGMSAYYATVNEANALADKAVKVGQATYGAALTGVKDAAAVGVVGAEGAIAGTYEATKLAIGVVKAGVSPAVGAATTAVDAYRAVNRFFFPAQPVVVPCIKCLDHASAKSRAARIRKRNALIQKAMAGNDPAAKEKAAQLKDDMVAVEMARLSQNSYGESCDKPPKLNPPPPAPWKAMTDTELKSANIDPELLKTSKAVIYQLPPDFPMEPKTVLAFRGTTSDPEDILADHDQALGLKNAQYSAAQTLGRQVQNAFPDAEVTGHSLGGGKAQAAGVAGGLKGMMFNSAGLNPKTVGLSADDLDAYSDDFGQYRAEGGITSAGGDPLTGLQNSPKLQKVAYGLAKEAGNMLSADQWARNHLGMAPLTDSLPEGQRGLASQLSDRLINITSQEAAKNYEFSGGKWYIPPAIGPVKGLPSKNADGSDTAASNQHSICNIVNGFEYRKFASIEVLLKATKTEGNAASYLGPTDIQMK